VAQETIRELVVKYGIDVDTGPMEQFDQAISALKGGLIGLGSVVASATAGILGTAISAAHAGDELIKMSQRTGVGVEALQALRFQAQLADVDSQQLGQGLQILSRNLNGAAKGSADLMKAFSKVGISAGDIKSGAVSAEVALQKIGQRFAKMPDGVQKTALAMEYFGRSGAQMIPFLNSLAAGLTETQKAVLQMNMVTEEQARLGEEFNDSVTVMQSALGGIAKTVGMGLLPTLKDLVEEFTAFIVANRDLIKANLTDFIKGLVSALKLAGRFLFVVGNSMAAFARTVGGVGNAVKLVLGAVTALSAASILFGIGKMITAGYALAGAFTAANAAALLIPTLIGAAVLLVILVIDDLIAFFQGRDSVTAVIIEKFQGVLNWFQTTFPNLAKYLIGFFEFWKAYLNLIISLWQRVFSVIGAVASFIGQVLQPVLEVISTIVSKIASGISMAVGFATDLASKLGGGILGKIGGGLSFAAGGMNALADYVSPSVPSPAGGGGGVNVQAPIQITVPPGTDPTQVGPYVQRGIGDGLDATLRGARRASVSGVSY